MNMNSRITFSLLDIPAIAIYPYSSTTNYTLEGTTIWFICFDDRTNCGRHNYRIELLKDGTPNHPHQLSHYHYCGYHHHWYYYDYWGHYHYTNYFTARESDTGIYQCRLTSGAASRYSSSVEMVVGSKPEKLFLLFKRTINNSS
jgi:hypothetical protein